MKHKFILLALVFSLVIVSQDSQSLGMGKIQVNSALDEPLNATINIMASESEPIDQVSVVLANSADYKKVGLDKTFVPSNILVSLDEANPYQINVTSNGPVSEPIVSLLLDVTWPNGRILREFTLLLDPPTYQASSSGSVEMAAVTNSESDTYKDAYVVEEPVADEPLEVEPIPSDVETAQADDIPPVSTDLNQMQESQVAAEAEVITEPTPTESLSPVRQTQNTGEVYVNAGDTLWRIANQNRGTDVTTHQMMMAIYEKNPQAFHNNNINQMLKGSTLAMPDAADVNAISYNDALAEVKAQHDSWAAENDSYSSYQTEAEDTVSEVVADTPDYGVQLSGGDGNQADSEQTQGEETVAGSSAMDDVDAYNASSETEELQSRVSELESLVDEQQAALQLEDDDLANLETQLGEADKADTLSEGGFDQAESDETIYEEDNLDETLVDDQMVDDVWDSADELTENGTNIGVTDDDTEIVDAANVDESDVDDMASEAAVIDEQSTSVNTQPVVPANKPWYSQAIDWFMNNILWVIIGLVVLLLLVLIPRFFNREEEVADEGSFLDDIKSSRRNDTDDADETESIMTEENDETVVSKPVSVDEVDIESEDDDIDFATLSNTDDDDDEDDDDDVLADLDSSLKFDRDEASDEADDDEDVFDFDFDDDKDDESDDDEFVDETPTKEYDPKPFMAVDDVAEEDTTEEDVTEEDDIDDDFSLDDLEDSADDADSDSNEDLEKDLGNDFEDDLEDDFDGTFDLDAELEDELDTDEDENDSTKLSSTDEESIFDEDDFLSELDDLEAEDEDNFLDDVSTKESTIDDESKEDGFEDVLSLDDQEGEETAAFDADEDDEMDESIDLGLDDLMGEGDVIVTKLDLAKAYIEMGDTEGAKNLLTEVISEGNTDQVNTANKLLDEM